MRRPPYEWVVVGTLGVTETISYGVLFYAFSVFITPMQASLGWSRAETTGAFSLALLVSGLAAYPVGHWLDERGPRLLMTAGSCAGVLLLLAWAHVHDLVRFYLVWAGIGLAWSAVLYPPAFATVAAWFHERRAHAITVLTLMAGTASLIFVPLAGWLVRALEWRTALVVLAAILAAGTVLPHALVLRKAPHRDEAASGAAPSLLIGAVVRLPGFWWLTVAFTLMAFVDIAMAVHLVPYLTGIGFAPAFAAAALGLVGLSQLLGRVVFVSVARLLPGPLLSAAVFALEAIGFLVLLAGGAAGVLAFVLLYGAGRGAMTILRANVIAELYGRRHYGRISGLFTLFIVTGQALGPVSAGAAYDAIGGYTAVIVAMAAIAGAAAGAVAVAGRLNVSRGEARSLPDPSAAAPPV